MLRFLLMGIALATLGASDSAHEGDTSHYHLIDFEGVPAGDDVYVFPIDVGPQLRIKITQYGICEERRKAFGVIVSTETRGAISPENSNYLSYYYIYCSGPFDGSECQSLCCSWVQKSFSGYLYRDGTLEDGSPRFVVSRRILPEPSVCSPAFGPGDVTTAG